MHTHTRIHTHTDTHTHTHFDRRKPPQFPGGGSGGVSCGGVSGGVSPTGGGFQTPRSRNSGPPNKSTPTLFVPFWGFWKRVCTIAWGGSLRSTFSQLFAAHGIQFYLSQHTTHICAYTHTHTHTHAHTHTHTHAHTHNSSKILAQQGYCSPQTLTSACVVCIQCVCARVCVWYDVMYRIASDV